MKSAVWGNLDFEITQNQGDNYPDVPDDWYAYVVDWGVPYGSHMGTDIGMPNGTPLYAIAPGVADFAGEDLSAYRPGHVDIRWQQDGRTEVHIYGHMQQVLVSTGDTIRAGQHIGYSGEQTVRGTRTPDGSGPHLHFERRDMDNHVALDPVTLLTTGNVTPEGDTGGGASNWPTADAIDKRIAKSESGNNMPSPLHGTGADFLRFGEQYGINPGIVCAIMQRECQLGAAGNDVLIPYNNFGGNTAGDDGSVKGTAGSIYLLDRWWQTNKTPQDGLEAVFKNLNSDLYRNTDGTMTAIMHLYSPEFENDWSDMWAIFASVGTDLGITIGPDTKLYGKGGGGAGKSSGGGSDNWADGLIASLKTGMERAALGILGLAVLAVGIVITVGPDKVMSVIPAGRAVKAMKALS